MAEQEIVDSDERREFLEARRGGVFASDTPKILGLSKRGSALSVYRDKTGESEERAMSLPAWLGLKMENVVAEMYTAKTGQRVRRDDRNIRSKQYEWLGTHLDFRAWGNPRLLVEAKTRAYMTGWGEEGTEEIPPDIWAQVQHEMLVTGADRCDVAVLFGHHTFRVYPIARNEEFLGPLVPKLEAFWYGNVIARVPPAPGPNDGPYVAAMHPTNDGSMSSATPEQESLIRQLLIALGNVQQAQLAKQELENRVKRLIGDRDGLTGSFGTITWKQVRDSKTTDWELVAKVRGDMVDQLLEMANPGGDEEAVRKLAHIQSLAPGVVALYTRIVPGYRRMNYTLKEEA